MRVMQRRATDDFYALLVANAMEAAGASVFDLTRLPNGSFIGWAKVQSDEQIDEVDDAIDKEVNAHASLGEER